MPDGDKDEEVPGVCVGCGQPAATPLDLVCLCCAALLEAEERAWRWRDDESHIVRGED